MSENETPRTHTSSQQPDREHGEESAGSSGLASSLFKSLDGLRRRVSDQRRAVHSSAPEKAPASAARDASPRDAAEAVPWSLRVGAAVAWRAIIVAAAVGLLVFGMTFVYGIVVPVAVAIPAGSGCSQWPTCDIARCWCGAVDRWRSDFEPGSIAADACE